MSNENKINKSNNSNSKDDTPYPALELNGGERNTGFVMFESE